MTLAPGTRLGPYEILSPLGAGGMGEVWKAKDTRLDRLVAVKVLPEHLAKSPDSLARFEREAKAVAALNHPNITAIHDIGQVDETTYVVMELLEGESLRARLQQGPIPARKATELAIQMAQGLAAAHDKGVIHRDLKPDNLWIAKEGRLKILDFGLAKQLPGVGRGSDSFMPTAAISPGHHTEKGLILGTLGYMSPEQVRGESVDARSDLFSLGAVVYEMLTGRRAFARDSDSDTLAAILRDDPPEFEGGSRSIPLALRRIIDHCLEKIPAHRFRDAHDLAFALESLSGPESTASLATPFAPQHRRVTMVWGAVVVALVLTVSTVTWMLRPRASFQARFTPLTLDTEIINQARFTLKGQTVIFSTESRNLRTWRIQAMDLGNPISRKLLDQDALLLSLGPQDEMAVLTSPRLELRSDTPVGTLGRCLPGLALPRFLAKDVLGSAWGPDGKLALIRRTGTRYGFQLEYPEGRVLLSEPDGWLSDVRFSPDGRKLALARHPQGADDMGPVAVVDLATGKVRDITPSWSSLRGLAWAPDGREVWFTAAAGDEINRHLFGVDLRGHVRRVFSGPVGVYLHDIGADGRVLLSARDFRSRVRVYLEDRHEPVDLSVSSFSQPRDLSADGGWAILDDESSSSGPNYPLYLRPTDGSLPTPLGMGLSAKFSLDGKRLCLWRWNGTQWNPSILTLGGGEEAWAVGSLKIQGASPFAWNATGELFVVASLSGEPLRLWQLGPQGPTVMPIQIPQDIVELAWPGPAGRSLILHSRNQGWFTAEIELSGAALKPILGLLPTDGWRGASADGHWIYVSPDRTTEFQRVDLRTGRREPFRRLDDAGFPSRNSTTLSQDGRTFLSLDYPEFSRLYLVEGLK